jgi:NaMN:DMB phosphoribosyltransferase
MTAPKLDLGELKRLANQIAKMQATAENDVAHDYWKTGYAGLHCAASIGIDAIERAIARIEELEAKAATDTALSGKGE